MIQTIFTKKELRDEFKKITNREPKMHEEINLETDVNILMKLVLKKLEEHETRIKKLE